MGVILQELSKMNFTNNTSPFWIIEYNEGPIIHIQNKDMRIEMNIEEFKHFAKKIISSADKLLSYKTNINIDILKDNVMNME